MFHVKSALFVDFQNIAGKLGAAFARSLPAWLGWLEDGHFDPERRKRRLLERRAYFDPNNHRAYGPAFQAAGFDTIPTAADMMLALDLAESIYTRREITEYIVLTVDRDFSTLLEWVGDRQKKRVAMFEKGTPSEVLFPDRAETVFSLEALASALAYERKPGLGKRAVGFARPILSRTSDVARSTGLRIYERYRAARRRAIDRQALKAAAEHVAALAEKTPGLPIGRKTVTAHLARHMPQYRAASQFFGCTSYEDMAEQIAKLRPELQLFRYPNGGMAIIAPKE